MKFFILALFGIQLTAASPTKRSKWSFQVSSQNDNEDHNKSFYERHKTLGIGGGLATAAAAIGLFTPKPAFILQETGI